MTLVEQQRLARRGAPRHWPRTRHACHAWLAALMSLALAGCDDDAGLVAIDASRDAAAAEPMVHDAATVDAATAELDRELSGFIDRHELTGDPALRRGLSQIKPAQDALVRLGQVLFFSQTLSGGFDSSCGTCHHPDFAGSDGLSISVGVVPVRRSAVGPKRRVDPERDLDPQRDGGPNMHRNSPTSFNVSLFDRALFADGRLFVVDDELVPGGHGQAIRTPESGQRVVKSATFGMLETMTPFPFVNDNEMRGFMYTEMADPQAYRDHLLDRLRGRADAKLLASDAPARWLALFRAAFEQPKGDASALITMTNLQTALGAYLRSQVFVETPWKRYVQGDHQALDESAKKGALLFLGDEAAGGLGCVSCHSGDAFTSERFVNAGLPQAGRGFRRADRRDVGRWLVTRDAPTWLTFRVPNLLNVALTAPYGHSGTFASLEDLLRYHADPRHAVERFDFTFSEVEQLAGVSYPDAEAYTREAIAHPSFAESEKKLPGRALGDDELAQLVSFLNALTDDCAGDPECRSAWTPEASLDPDGHMLVRDRDDDAPAVDASFPKDYPAYVDLSFRPSAPRTTFTDAVSCQNGLSTAKNSGEPRFVNRTGSEAFGLTAPHGFSVKTWDETAALDFEAIMMAGGASAAHLDGDCWPDIVFAGGDASGLVFYRNRGQQLGFGAEPMIDGALASAMGTLFTGVAIADLDADYRRELVFGNVTAGQVSVLALADDGTYYRVGALPTTRNTFGISFGLLQPNDYPAIYLGHWSGLGTAGTAPALFRNRDGSRLVPFDDVAKTSSAYVDQPFNFTPKLADFDGDGLSDLVIASDFGTSNALRNEGAGVFANVTDRSVITDHNGMGSALGDFDNDGKLDWFVTSVLDPTGHPLGNWGVNGNRLYRNVSSEAAMRFEDATEQAGVRDGGWGWGACAADFDHDGFLDLFHVNGFGWVPEGLDPHLGYKEYYDSITAQFQGMAPRLFMNAGDGTFTEQTQSWGLDVPSEGRSVACFDYDRDGDVDILLLDHSVGLQFFENQIGHGSGHAFLDVRAIGKAPNTEALGAQVTVTADIGSGHGPTTQLRVSEANSNFNGQSLPDLHFGLGSAQVVSTLRVTWPGDSVALECHDVAPGQFLVLDQRDKRCP